MGILRKCANGVCRTWFRELIFTLLPAAVMTLTLVLMYVWQEQHQTVGRRVLLRHSLPPLADAVQSYFDQSLLETEMAFNMYHTGAINDPRDTIAEASLLVPYLWSVNRNVPWIRSAFRVKVAPDTNETVTFTLDGGAVSSRRQRYRTAGSVTRRRVRGTPFQNCDVTHTPGDSFTSRNIVITDVESPAHLKGWFMDPTNRDGAPQLRFGVQWIGQCAEVCQGFACECVSGMSHFAIRYRRNDLNKVMIADSVCSLHSTDTCTTDYESEAALHVMLIDRFRSTIIAYNGLENGKNLISDYPAITSDVVTLMTQVNSATSTNFTLAGRRGRSTHIGRNLALVSLVDPVAKWDAHDGILDHVLRVIEEQREIPSAFQQAASGGTILSVDDWETFQQVSFAALLSHKALYLGLVHIGQIPIYRISTPDNIRWQTTDMLLMQISPADDALETITFFESPTYADETVSYIAPRSGGYGLGLRGSASATIVEGLLPSQTTINGLYTNWVLDLTNQTANHIVFDVNSGLVNGTRAAFWTTPEETATCAMGAKIAGDWFQNDRELRALLFNIGVEQNAADVAIMTADGTYVASAGDQMSGTFKSTKLWDVSSHFRFLQAGILTKLQRDFSTFCTQDTEELTCDVKTNKVIGTTIPIKIGTLTTSKVDFAFIGNVSGTQLYLVLNLPAEILNYATFVDKAGLIGAVIFAFFFFVVNIISVIHTTITVSNLKTQIKQVACGSPERINPAAFPLSSNSEIRSLQESVLKVRNSMVEFKSFVPSVVFQGDGKSTENHGLLASAVYHEAERRVDGDEAPAPSAALVHPRDATLRSKELLVMRLFLIDATRLVERMGPSSFSALNGRIIDVVRECVDPMGGTLGNVSEDAFDCYWAKASFDPSHVMRAAAELQTRLTKAMVGWMTQGFAPPLQCGIVVGLGTAFSGFIGPATDRSFVIGGELMLQVSALQRTVTFLQGKSKSTRHTGLRTVDIPAAPCLLVCDAKCSAYDYTDIAILPIFNPTHESPHFFVQLYDGARRPHVQQYTSRYTEALAALAASDKVLADSLLTQFATLCTATSVIPEGHPVVEYLREEIQSL